MTSFVPCHSSPACAGVDYSGNPSVSVCGISFKHERGCPEKGSPLKACKTYLHARFEGDGRLCLKPFTDPRCYCLQDFHFLWFIVQFMIITIIDLEGLILHAGSVEELPAGGCIRETIFASMQQE